MEERNERNEEQISEEQTPSYVPRPAWQVWGARIGLVLFIIPVILYSINISRGGA